MGEKMIEITTHKQLAKYETDSDDFSVSSSQSS